MENKNNSKSARRKLFFTRCGIFAILLLMLLPILCSAAPPPQTAQVTVTIENPNNIPQDMTISNSTVGGALEFGTNLTSGDVITVVDGVTGDGETDLPDGEYIMVGIMVEQPAGFNNTLVPNGDLYSIDGLTVFLSNAPKLTVAESDQPLTIALIPFIVPMPNPTDSLLNTWTSITNWVISSINTVQGVFYSNDSILPYLDISDTLTFFDTPLYLMTTNLGNVYYNGVHIELVENLETTTIGVFEVVRSNGVTLLAIDTSTAELTSYANPVLTVSASAGGLTLLGTLAVIGVSIGICYLLIGIIQRFLKLRG